MDEPNSKNYLPAAPAGVEGLHGTMTLPEDRVSALAPSALVDQPSDDPVAVKRSGAPRFPAFSLVLLDSMTEGVSLTSEDGTIVYTNAAEDRMFGYQPREMVGLPVSVQNAYPPEENARIVGDVIAEMKRSGAWRGEWRNRRKDGSAFITTSRISAVEMEGRSYWLCV